MVRSWFTRAAGQVATGLDEAFNGLVLGSSEPRLSHAERIAALAQVEAFYNRAELAPALFPQPEPIAPKVSRLRRLAAGGDLLALRWESAFEPLWAEATQGPDGASFRERYLGVLENRSVHARWFRHSGAPRPCAVLLHGYASGSFAVEERVWPIDQLFRSGLDVVQTVLPFHGARRDPRRGLRPPAFPVAADVRFGIEGMRQLVFDHSALFDHLAREGTTQLGAMGMSFGGYSTALLATLDPRLQFAVLLVPLAHLEPRAWSDQSFSADSDLARERAALRRAQRAVSPLTRPSLLADGRSIVIAGELDRVTGLAHAETLAEHLRAELHRFAGGHLLQLGRARAFTRVMELLARTGLVS